MDDPVPQIEVPSQRMGQGMFGAQAGIAEGHGGGNRGDAELFQRIKRLGLDGALQVFVDKFDGLQ